jgi:hypothetical protein
MQLFKRNLEKNLDTWKKVQDVSRLFSGEPDKLEKQP